MYTVEGKDKYTCTGLDSPRGLQVVEAPKIFTQSIHKAGKVVALHTGRLYPPGKIPGTHFSHRLSRPQGHSAAGRIKSRLATHVHVGLSVLAAQLYLRV